MSVSRPKNKNDWSILLQDLANQRYLKFWPKRELGSYLWWWRWCCERVGFRDNYLITFLTGLVVTKGRGLNKKSFDKSRLWRTRHTENIKQKCYFKKFYLLPTKTLHFFWKKYIIQYKFWISAISTKLVPSYGMLRTYSLKKYNTSLSFVPMPGKILFLVHKYFL